MKSIAILIADCLIPENRDPESITVIEGTRQLAQLETAFANADLQVSLVPWRTATDVAANYDAVLPLLVWDYFENNEAAFAESINEAAQLTNVFNSPQQLQWNANKRYLDDLQQQGAAVIETMIVDRITPAACQTAFDRFGCDQLVIKPTVGGGAWRQVLLSSGDPFPDAEELPPDEAMIQPFQANVLSDGEFSFLYFEGKFSHGLVKRAAPGDYRVQGLYGGTEEKYTPTDDERSTAKAILSSLPEMPLYARVDLLRGGNGKLQLIELELIEPFLYLSYAEEIDGLNQGADMLANALAERLR
ncbi:MAG: hypothetical protein AAFN77_00225 [Planctomycetota bacterium]